VSQVVGGKCIQGVIKCGAKEDIWASEERGDRGLEKSVHCSLNIVWVIKLKECNGQSMWHIWERRDAQRVLVQKCEGKRPRVRPSCKWRIILKCIIRSLVRRTWTGLIWLRVGTSGRLL